MKGMIIGLAAGFALGAVLVRTCKPCKQIVDDMTQAVGSKMKGMQSGNKSASTECECGSDCNCDCCESGNCESGN